MSTRKGTRKVAEAYLEFLYSPEGQAIAAKHYYRPRRARRRGAADIAPLPEARRCSRIDERFGGWTKAQATHFADGGIFDQIYKPEQLTHGRAPSPVRTGSAQPSVIPGFGLALGFTLTYLGLIVLIPLAALFAARRRRSAWPEFWHIVTDAAHARRARAQLRRRARRRRRQPASSACSSPGCWCATTFPASACSTRMVDLPFALPTAVAGIALAALYAPQRLDRRSCSSRSASRSPTRRSASSWR